MKQKIIQNIKSIILALILVVGVSYAYATTTWSPYHQIAPACDPSVDSGCNAPLNVTYSPQIKNGNLWIKGLSDATHAFTNGLIVENGNVGIGTTNPSGLFQVGGGAGAYTYMESTPGWDQNHAIGSTYVENGFTIPKCLPCDTDNTTVNCGTSFSSSADLGAACYDTFNLYNMFWSKTYVRVINSSLAFMVSSNGNVGIGTPASLNRKLDIAQIGDNYNYGLGIQNVEKTVRLNLWADDSNRGHIDGGSGSSPILINTTSNGNGYVGIGAVINPSYPLDVAGNADVISWKNSAGTQLGRLGVASTGGSVGWIGLFNAGTQSVDIRASGISYFNGGKVGIGTTTPAYKLDVTGGVNASQFCISGNCITAWPSGGGGGISGTGTAYSIPRWTGASTLGDSLITDDGISVTINGPITIHGATTILSNVSITGDGAFGGNATVVGSLTVGGYNVGTIKKTGSVSSVALGGGTFADLGYVGVTGGYAIFSYVNTQNHYSQEISANYDNVTGHIWARNMSGSNSSPFTIYYRIIN